MAWVKDKGILVWKGDLGSPPTHVRRSEVSFPLSQNALGTFFDALLTYTDCKRQKASIVESNQYGDPAPGADVNVDRWAKIFFRDPTTLGIHSFSLPGIKSSAVEGTNRGERVTLAALSAIVTAINTLTGKSYTPLYGVVMQRR